MIFSGGSTLDGLDDNEGDGNIDYNTEVDKSSNPSTKHKKRKSISTLAVANFDEIPSRWTSFVTSFMSSPTIFSAVESLPYFPLILKASCYWLKSLTRDCCEQFQPHLVAIHEKYVAVGVTIENQLRMPYIFIDQETFENAELLSRHKFATLKLNESIQILQEKREQAIEQLESIQRYTKKPEDDDDSFGFTFFGQDNDKHRTKSSRLQRGLLNLGSCLYRLHVQFVMCLEIYQSYLSKIVKTTKKLGVSSMIRVRWGCFRLIICS